MCRPLFRFGQTTLGASLFLYIVSSIFVCLSGPTSFAQETDDYRYRYRVVGEGEAWTYTHESVVNPKGVSGKGSNVEVQARTGEATYSESVIIKVKPRRIGLSLVLILIVGLLVALKYWRKTEQERERRKIEANKNDRDNRYRKNAETYRKTLEEVERLRKISAVLSEISTKFINLPVNKIEDEIYVALKKVGEAAGVQRASISFFEADRKFTKVHYQWCAPGVKEVPKFLQRFDVSLFPYSYNRLLEGQPTFFSDQNIDFPEGAAEEFKVVQQLDIKSIAVLPLMVEGETIGHLGLTTVDRKHDWPPSIIDDISVAGQVFANAFARRDRIRAMYSLREDALDAAERERTRVSREIHDQLGGALSGLRILARALEDELKKAKENRQLAENAGRIVEIIDDTITDVRRLCAELRPTILDTLKLEQAVEWQAVEFTKNTGIPCQFDLQFTDPPAPNTGRDVALYRITQELLTNVTRHAGATEVSISLGRDEAEGSITLTVEDNGKGIDFHNLKQKRQHFGLRGVKERAELLNGKVKFENKDPGVRIEVVVPDCGEKE